MSEGRELLIEEAKRKIAHRANCAGFRFFPEDILAEQVGDKTVVLLRRAFMGYEENEEGILILDENFDSIPIFKPLIWLEYLDRPPKPTKTGLSAVKTGVIEMLLLRVIMPCPWLAIMIDEQGEMK